MPGVKSIVHERVGSESKIRKRDCSSSSSSSLVRSYRLKRAILAGKRAGSSTPVPTWKMDPNSPPPPPPPCAVQNSKSMQYPPSKDLSVSARKLAATLWEINGVSEPQQQETFEGKKTKKISNIASSFDPTPEPSAERLNRSKGCDARRRAVPKLEAMDSIHNASVVEIEAESHGRIRNRRACLKTRLKDVSSGLTASKELLRVLNRIWTKEEQNSSILSLVSALRFELDRARVQVDQLIHEQRSNRYEVDYLLKQFSEEKVAWKHKEQDKVRNAISSIAGELEIEKKLRRQTERLNKKLGRELADTKESLSNALKEVENEKRAREILEQVCDELARGIGEDRAQVEEIKRESAKAREEVEKEREMLQLADVLREERVQMKLSEAKYEYEEKNAVVDKLRSELEAYLSTNKSAEGDKVDASPSFNRIKELEEYLRNTLGASCQNGELKYNEGEVVNSGEDEGEDSTDSDLQSIELNVDNMNKSYNWGYARTDVHESFDLRRGSVEQKTSGRRSTTERNQKRRSLSLEGRNSDAIEWDFSVKSQENTEGFDRRKLLELASQGWRNENYGDEVERYEMLRDLRDHILSGTSITSSQGFASSKTPIGT